MQYQVVYKFANWCQNSNFWSLMDVSAGDLLKETVRQGIKDG